MKPSNFQFTDPYLFRLDYQINKDFVPAEYAEGVEVSVSFDHRIGKDEEAKEAIVELTVTIGQEDASVPFFIVATEAAKFRWNDEMTEEMVEVLLNQNAPSLLLGYLRPLVATVTAAGPLGAYHIPFMNFTKTE